MELGVLDVVLILTVIFACLGVSIILYRDKLFSMMQTAQINKASKTAPGGGSLPLDYNIYVMTPIEKLQDILSAAIILFAVGYIFYRSILLSMLLTLFCFYYPKMTRAKKLEKRKQELKLQFKDALLSISSSLYTGKSLESSIKNAISDLEIQYEKDSYIILELEMIVRKLEANETVEKAFFELAERSHIDEIHGFAEVLEICKRTGGNLITAIKNSTDIISDKIEVINDIKGIISQKKLEQRILMVMPVLIICMLSVSAEEFMEPVFTEPMGRVAMTISIILFGAAYMISERITNIEV